MDDIIFDIEPIVYVARGFIGNKSYGEVYEYSFTLTKGDDTAHIHGMVGTMTPKVLSALAGKLIELGFNYVEYTRKKNGISRSNKIELQEFKRRRDD
jgi:hypothetical protein